MKVTRREAIKVGAAGAVAAGIAYRVAGLPGLTQILEPGPTPPVRPSAAYVPSVCLQCPAGCGILVRVVDGRAVKIEGNPLHPINEGRLCPKGQIGLQILYDPDRIKTPLKRVGERGSGQWQPISWDVAVATVAGRLKQIRDQGQAHTV